MMALARKLVSGETDDEAVEDIFLEAQQVAADAEALLVDDSWRPVEPTPEPLVLPTGATVDAESAVAVIPCEHHTGNAPEQRDLFSWAEFLSDEPQPTKNRRRKQVEPSVSLFEWALEREQQSGLAAAGG